MRRFRKFMRPVPLLALVAAVQVALILGQSHALMHARQHAAGHIHHSAADHASAHRKSPALACRAIVQHKSCNDAPVRDENHDCSLCWITATASGGMLPVVSALQPRADRVAVAAAPLSTPLAIIYSTADFDARGPPSA